MFCPLQRMLNNRPTASLRLFNVQHFNTSGSIQLKQRHTATIIYHWHISWSYTRGPATCNAIRKHDIQPETLRHWKPCDKRRRLRAENHITALDVTRWYRWHHRPCGSGHKKSAHHLIVHSRHACLNCINTQTVRQTHSQTFLLISDNTQGRAGRALWRSINACIVWPQRARAADYRLYVLTSPSHTTGFEMCANEYDYNVCICGRGRAVYACVRSGTINYHFYYCKTGKTHFALRWEYEWVRLSIWFSFYFTYRCR